MRRAATVLLLLVGIVNALPAIGVVSSARIESAYGVVLDDPNLAVLMRHRAVLFAIVGGLLIAGALHAPLRRAGIAAGFVSMLSFVAIALWIGDTNASLQRIAWIDVLASLALAAAVALDRLSLRSRSSAEA